MARSKARQPTSWLVLLAFVFSTLAPSLAMGLGGPDASRIVWAQLCSVDGPELVAIQVDGDPDSTSSQIVDAQEGHCLLCFHPSTSPEDVAVTPATRTDFVLRIAAAPNTPPQNETTWSPALARAPPATS
ncbi:DUF2946 domain-containing protein [Pusillimonas sp.]|uniref:DUF2946 domain-containing protein n=1 Tax=Pusillimonas sp. TaxID=3040095 RepID=UPI0037CAB357